MKKTLLIVTGVPNKAALALLLQAHGIKPDVEAMGADQFPLYCGIEEGKDWGHNKTGAWFSLAPKVEFYAWAEEHLSVSQVLKALQSEVNEHNKLREGLRRLL